MENAIDRLPALLKNKGTGKSTHYVEVKLGLWTEPVSLGPRAKGWPRRENELLLAARIAGKSNDEIRALVQRLHAERRSATTSRRASQRVCDTCNGSGVNPNTDEECQDCSGSGYEPSSD